MSIINNTKHNRVYVEKPEFLESILDDMQSRENTARTCQRPKKLLQAAGKNPQEKSIISDGMPMKSYTDSYDIQREESFQAFGRSHYSITDRSQSGSMQRIPLRKGISKSSLSNNFELSRMDRSQGINDQMYVMVRKQLEREQQRRDNRFAALLNDIECSKETIKDANRTLNEFDFTKQHKHQQQYEEWNKNIHGTIQQQINQKVSAMDPKKLHRMKYDDYSKFLDITNKKPNIFRDTIIESEYDPLEPNRRALKVKLDPFKRDPTIIDQQKMYEEAAMLNPNCKRPVLSTGKQTLPVELWASEKVTSTSFGFSPECDTFSSTQSSHDIRERNREDAKRNNVNKTAKSSIIFDHFNFPTGKEAIDAEMPKGKRSIAVQNTLILD